MNTHQNMKTDYIYHIIPAIDWEKESNNNEYSPASLAKEGFIHFSYQDQVIGTINRYYRGIPDLVILKVDSTQLIPAIRVEQSPLGGWFPHVFGPLNLNAVISVLPVHQDDQGNYHFDDIIR